MNNTGKGALIGGGGGAARDMGSRALRQGCVRIHEDGHLV